MEETISLQEIFATLRKRIKMILLITIAAIGLSGIVSFFIITPQYEAATQLLVNQETDSQAPLNVNDLRTNVELINTYSVIITSPAILDLAIEELSLSQTTSELRDQVSVRSEGDSQVVAIEVQSDNPELAVTIANTIASTFESEISSIMNIDNVSILAVASAEQVESPVSPQPLLNMAIAMVVGMMAGVGLAFLFEYLDNTIKTQQDVEEKLGITLIGVIPQFTEADQKPAVQSLSKKRGERQREKEEVYPK
ncbi:capsular biosynthesis protein [Bacillaceae bacterium JMAK1]|nr:capsular biosynthesis protein [Bacillaceae bacterium JMAK1]